MSNSTVVSNKKSYVVSAVMSFTGVLAAVPVLQAVYASPNDVSAQARNGSANVASPDDTYGQYAYAYTQGYLAQATASQNGTTQGPATCDDPSVNVEQQAGSAVNTSFTPGRGGGQPVAMTTQGSTSQPVVATGQTNGWHGSNWQPGRGQGAGQDRPSHTRPQNHHRGNHNTTPTRWEQIIRNSYNQYHNVTNKTHNSTVNNTVTNSNNTVGSNNTTQNNTNIANSHNVEVSNETNNETSSVNLSESLNSDSYNHTTETTTNVANDSFNHDTTIVNDSYNHDTDTTVVNDSFNETNTEVVNESYNDTDTTLVNDSFNHELEVTNDSYNDTTNTSTNTTTNTTNTSVATDIDVTENSHNTEETNVEIDHSGDTVQDSYNETNETRTNGNQHGGNPRENES